MERLVNLIIMAGCLAEKVIEECSAVVYMGSIQYLTHTQRVAIIQGSGPDFDLPPSDFDGPATKPHINYNFIEPKAPYFVTTEWDGSKHPVHAVDIEGNAFDNYLNRDMIVTYKDGVQHQMSTADFRLLVGEWYNRRCHGRPTNGAGAVTDALTDTSEIPYEDGEELNF